MSKDPKKPPVHYLECPVCEACFRLPITTNTLPPHRAFKGPGLCEGGVKS